MPEGALLAAAPDALLAARAAAVDWLLERQSPQGWWTGELRSNATMTAEHVLLLRFLGAEDRLEHIREGSVRHLLQLQRDDGSWALWFDGPADLSTTAECYTALRVLGLDAAAPPLVRARRVVLEQGGLARVRVFTRIWLALFGEVPWEGVPSMPPELVWLPPRVPFNLYDFSCWARGTIAPLLVVLSRRPRRRLGVSVQELVVAGTAPLLRRVPGSGPFWWLDHLQKAYERLPIQPGRRAATRRVLDWVLERQEADGSWGGIQPPWVYSMIALSLEGMGLDHPVMRAAVAGLDAFSEEDGDGWRLQACESPVWDTALAVLALRGAGVPAAHPAIRRAADWLLAEQVVDHLGDWAVRVPGTIECGGWAFEFANDWYPDVDDTAEVVLALLTCEQRPEVARAVELGRRWVLAMRSRGGIWGAFDRDNTREVVYRLPFADFGALLDPPSEDVTAHCLEMLAHLGHGAGDPAVAPALRWLAGVQRPAGSWFGRWGVNHVYGTWSVLQALAALGTGAAEAARGTAWLAQVQNGDGGFGEDCISYEDESFAGVGRSTASQTAWGLLGLRAGGAGGGTAAARAAAWLVERQRPDGTWEQPQHTGTGFPRDFYLDYTLYRHLFPLTALGDVPMFSPSLTTTGG